MTGPYLLSQLVVAGAEKDPDAPAVRSVDGALTYGELVQRTAALAATLQGLGVGRGDRVGVYLHKSVAAFAAIHGVLRAGAAYVPIDPFAPVNLVARLVQDCGIQVLVSETAKAPQLTQLARLGSGLRAVVGPTKPVEGLTIVGPDDLASAYALVTPASLSEDIAYVMYTSGSTGQPKGIVHTHRSGLSYARAAVQVYGVRPEDRLANSAPFHFDISTFELFAGSAGRGVDAGHRRAVPQDARQPVPAGGRRSVHVLVLGAVPAAGAGGSRCARIPGPDQLALGALRR